MSERLRASSGCPREVISPLPSTTTPSSRMAPHLFSLRTKKIGPFLSLFLHQWRPCSWPRASSLVPGKRLGLLPPRTPAPCLARVILKCTGGGEQSLDHTLEMAEGACPTFWKPVRVTSRFPKPWRGRAGYTHGARPLATARRLHRPRVS